MNNETLISNGSKKSTSNDSNAPQQKGTSNAPKIQHEFTFRLSLLDD